MALGLGCTPFIRHKLTICYTALFLKATELFRDLERGCSFNPAREKEVLGRGGSKKYVATPDADVPTHESLKGAWNLAEVIWKKHYEWSKYEWGRRMNLWRGRKMPPGLLKLHRSVSTPCPIFAIDAEIPKLDGGDSNSSCLPVGALSRPNPHYAHNKNSLWLPTSALGGRPFRASPWYYVYLCSVNRRVVGSSPT